MQRLADGPLVRLLPKGSELWLDGGHNASAARAIAQLVRDRFADGLPLVIVFASLGTKDPKAMLAPFRGLAANVLTLPIADHDSRDPFELVEVARSVGLNAEAFERLPDALSSIRGPSRVLICGSLYLAGEVLAANGSLPD